MYKAQYKAKNAFEVWANIGSYASESQAISMAQNKKAKGALMVRVIDSKGSVIYSG
jgi:hypothetical protein